MTDKQIIDGVDVSGCKHLDADCFNCEIFEEVCHEVFPDCYYKQLKRKEQECDQLKAENEKLKTKVAYYEKSRVESHKANIHNLVLFKRYKQALDEIEKTANKNFTHTAWEEYKKEIMLKYSDLRIKYDKLKNYNKILEKCLEIKEELNEYLRNENETLKN